MKILYDSQIFDMQKTGGVSRYFVEIISRLNNFNVEYELPLTYSKNVYLQENPLTVLNSSYLNCLYENFLPSMQFRGKRRLWNLRNKFFYKDFLTNRQRDIQARASAWKTLECDFTWRKSVPCVRSLLTWDNMWLDSLSLAPTRLFASASHYFPPEKYNL